MSDSARSYGLQPARLLCPWDSPGKSTRKGCHALLQGIFPAQGSNPGLRIACRLFPIWAMREALCLSGCADWDLRVWCEMKQCSVADLGDGKVRLSPEMCRCSFTGFVDDRQLLQYCSFLILGSQLPSVCVCVCVNLTVLPDPSHSWLVQI